MEQARSNWNDDRLDRLSDQVNGLRQRMDDRFDTQAARLDKRLEAQDERIDARFDALGARLDSLHRTLVFSMTSMLVAFVTVVVTQT
jgi:flagellar capping protein FliD